MQRRPLNSKRLVALALAALLLLASPAAMMGKNTGKDIEGVLPPQASILGKSQGEWSAEWWQWVWSQPATNHPLLDGTGTDFDLPGSSCDRGQKGQVWFLAGTFGGDATRECTITRDKFVFIPIFNYDADNVAEKPTHYDVKTLRQICLDTVADPDKLSVSLDGRELQDPKSYAVTPTTFKYTVPDVPDNIYRALAEIDFAGKVSPAVSCGWYVMLKPLDKGTHKLIIAAQKGDLISFQVIYKLNVVNPGIH
jgi:hypothetical protein